MKAVGASAQLVWNNGKGAGIAQRPHQIGCRLLRDNEGTLQRHDPNADTGYDRATLALRC